MQDYELFDGQPALSSRDVLLEVRSDVKAMKSNVDILVSQKLDHRVSDLEDWRHRRDGQTIAVAALVSFIVTAGGLAVAAVGLLSS